MTQLNKLDLNALISAYETDVQYPNVSSMEHLDMLLTRSVLAENAQQLTPTQQASLTAATVRWWRPPLRRRSTRWPFKPV